MQHAAHGAQQQQDNHWRKIEPAHSLWIEYAADRRAERISDTCGQLAGELVRIRPDPAQNNVSEDDDFEQDEDCIDQAGHGGTLYYV